MTVAPVFKAVLWMMATLASFTLMAVAVREVRDDISALEVMFFRSATALVILAPFFAWRGRKVLATARLKTHLGRNIVHIGGQLGWVYAIFLLPLAEVFALEFTTPIWAALMAALFLGERLTRPRLVAIGLGFAGILVIVQPGFGSVGIGTFVMLGAAVCFGATLTYTKSLAATDAPLTILTWMTLMQFPIVTVMALFAWTTPEPWHLPWLFLVGVTGLTAHYAYTRALQQADAAVVAPMDFMRLPLIAFVGYAVYAEAVDVLVIAGALLIFSGNYHAIRRESRAPAG